MLTQGGRPEDPAGDGRFPPQASAAQTQTCSHCGAGFGEIKTKRHQDFSDFREFKVNFGTYDSD